MENVELKDLRPNNLYLVAIKYYDGATFTIYEIFAKFIKSIEKKRYSNNFLYHFETEYSQIKTAKIKKLYRNEIHYVKSIEGINILELENFAEKPFYKIDE